jgi:VIT1/CCC1 family predicted Fe2+/Mn2+ transporter
MDRISEGWFGLIIVLTFTCTISVRNSGRQEVMKMILAAFGCNVAWGILDAFMYLTTCFIESARTLSLRRALHHNPDLEKARQVIADAIPPAIASVMSTQDLELLRTRLTTLPEVDEKPRIAGHQWREGLVVFLAVFLSTFPVAVPFLFISDPKPAMRVSNGIAVFMLFLAGYAFGSYAHYRPWILGFWMALLGVVLVAITIYLGG